MTSADSHPEFEPNPWAPGSSTPAQTRPRRRGLFAAAIVIFTVGVLFTISAAVAPFLLGHGAPTILYLGAMAFTPVGFLLGLLYAILGSRPPAM